MPAYCQLSCYLHKSNVYSILTSCVRLPRWTVNAVYPCDYRALFCLLDCSSGISCPCAECYSPFSCCLQNTNFHPLLSYRLQSDLSSTDLVPRRTPQACAVFLSFLRESSVRWDEPCSLRDWPRFLVGLYCVPFIAVVRSRCLRLCIFPCDVVLGASPLLIVWLSEKAL